MTNITAAMVKELRDRTGVGMSKCKEALSATGGDMDEAIAYLRKAGAATAVKKEGRETKEGLIGYREGDDVIALIEVNAETDFVVQNEKFQKFLSDIAAEVVATKPASIEAFLEQSYSKDSAFTIDQFRSTLVQSIGENIKLKRLLLIEKQSGHSYGVYAHMKGKIVTVVDIDGSADEGAVAKDIAMHVAAEAPEYLTSNDVPEEIKLHEEDIAKAQIKGKPENIIEKILVGKMNSFFDRVCLLRQAFVKDPSCTIRGLLEQHSKESGKTIAVANFIRWNVGQNS